MRKSHKIEFFRLKTLEAFKSITITQKQTVLVIRSMGRFHSSINNCSNDTAILSSLLVSML